MADFDPFSLNQEQKDNDMPVFGSFDTNETGKNDQNESNNQKNETKNQDGFGTFGSFTPFDSNPSNAFDNSGFPTFESFDSENKQTKEDNSMPTFESFATPSADTKSNSQSKPPTFDSDSDHNAFALNEDDKEKEPLYASLGESIRAISNIQQEEEVKQEEQQVISEEQQDNLHFPSFPAFESTKNKTEDLNTDINKSENINSNQVTEPPINTENKSKITPTPKTRQQENKSSATATLPSIKNLLKPIPGLPPTLDFYPDRAKISIQPPKPFKDTPLAKELSEYCMKVFNHQYVFTE